MRRATPVALLASAVMLQAALPVLAMPPNMGRPRFLEELFPPRLVMQHQTQIGLTHAQREAISKIMADTQKRLVDLRWRFEEQSTALTKRLAEPQVDADAALALSDRVMEVEREMKKAHLAMLIAIKNQLEPAQQEKLRALRTREPRHRRRGDTSRGEPSPAAP
jgi:Spy/CpxP family protein refolding chaperone